MKKKCSYKSNAFLIGELLAVDQPVVTYLDAQFSKTHCWNCLTSTTNGRILPCSGCSGVIFCSRHCRDKAEGSYHRFKPSYHAPFNALVLNFVERDKPNCFKMQLKPVKSNCLKILNYLR